MAQWTHVAYQKRLDYELRGVTTQKGMDRLRSTLRDVEGHLNATERDPDEDGWIALLSAYTKAATAVGLRHG